MKVTAVGSGSYSGSVTSAVSALTAACPITSISDIIGTTTAGETLTAGTVMHKSKLPLHLWFWAIYLVVNDRRGRSALSFGRLVAAELSDGLAALHKIRHACRNEMPVINYAAWSNG